VTNEELYEEYRNGNKLSLDELYSQNTKYIQRLADITAWRYASFFPCSDSADELFQVASFEFVQRIKSGNYDPQKAKLRTYVTPHMKYAMLEHIGMDRIGKNGKIYLRIMKCKRLAGEGIEVSEIAKQLGISESLAREYIIFPIRRYSIAPTDEDADIDEISEETIDLGAARTDVLADRNICTEYAKQLFDRLSPKERAILGRLYGVFGYDQMKAEDIGIIMMISRDAVMKSVANSIEKLHEMYNDNSDLLRWRCARRMAERTGKGNSNIL
jgi:RNA polymerase primary sigma factor